MKEEHSISSAYISYNITFKAIEGQSIEDSYVQIGPVSQMVRGNTSWLDTSSFNAWNVPVSNSFFQLGESIHPFLEFNAKAIFDPQVDHMYVNGMEFENLIAPVIRTMYGDDITCTANDCYFMKPCETVIKEHKQPFL